MLTFTDLSLPGNNGRALTFNRVFNNIPTIVWGTALFQNWHFSISGLPLKIVNHVDVPVGGAPISNNLPAERGFAPKLVMPDGSLQHMTFLNMPDTSSQEAVDSTTRWVVTPDFWRYDKVARTLYVPDGRIAQYDLNTGRLISFSDPFNNIVTLSWSADQLNVVQSFGNGESRLISIVMDMTRLLPLQMTHDPATWTYSYDTPGWLRTVQPPVGPSWQFTYGTGVAGGGKIATVTTPQGGVITYGYATFTFTSPPPEGETMIETLATRTASGSVTPWTFTYKIASPGATVAAGMIATLPSGRKIDHTYYPAGDEYALAGAWQLASRVVTDTDGVTEIEAEGRQYEDLRAGRTTGAWYVPHLGFRTITRAGRFYTTDYVYSGDTSNFQEFHRPSRIVEAGELTRTTEFDYQHLVSSLAWPYIIGLTTLETTSAGGQTASRGWTYNPTTGFRETETVSGITTTFTPDAQGNVGRMEKANGKWTQHTYSWGQVATTTTSEPGYGVTRVINPDSTVAFETQAGRTTAYQYDFLGRVTRVAPPAADPIVTTYAGNTVITTRGQSSTTTMLDGFGRPIETVNAANVRTVTAYDGEGRVSYQSLPFTGAGNGTGTYFTYDALGRVTTEDQPGDGVRSFAYVGNANGCAGVATIATDEESHTTELCRSAFGHPDDVRLTRVLDAAQNPWTYGYNVVGNLTSVSGPGGVARTWTYDAQNPHLLRSETHPELGRNTPAGTITYSNYDAAGVLKQKTDAKGTVFSYTHDGNDRLSTISGGGSFTSIGYEQGSDNRKSICVTETGACDVNNPEARWTAFEYDMAGRLKSRTDRIDGHVFTTTQHYDGENNLRLIEYPSFRQVEFRYGPQQQLTTIRNYNTDALYASGFDHHASGAIGGYTSGNLLTTSIGFDAQRYWIRSITVGGLGLTYDYYNAGNVLNITDTTRPDKSQSFYYDALDRLTRAVSTTFDMRFDYDAHGNRQTNQYATYTYDSGKPFHLRAVSNGPAGMQYDDNGNLESVGTPGIAMTYTPSNLMRTFTAGGSSTTYAYDADDWRVKKQTNGGVTTYFLRGPNGQLLTEWTNNTPTATVKDYVYAGERVIAVHESTSLQAK